MERDRQMERDIERYEWMDGEKKKETEMEREME